MLELDTELSLTTYLTWLQSDHAAAATFARVLGPLHWSNPRLTRLVRAEVLQLDEYFTRPLPDVCADLKAWVASDYETLPAATVEFLHSYEVSAKAAPPSPDALLARYEDKAEKALARRSKRLEDKLGAAFEAIGPIVERLLPALGLDGLSPKEAPLPRGG